MDAFMDIILLGVGGFLIAFLARICGEDAKTAIPRLAAWLVTKAAARTPEAESERWREEWLSHLNERPEMLSKLWHGVSCYTVGAYGLKNPNGYELRKKAHGLLDISHLGAVAIFSATMALLLSPMVLALALTLGWHRTQSIAKNFYRRYAKYRLSYFMQFIKSPTSKLLLLVLKDVLGLFIGHVMFLTPLIAVLLSNKLTKDRYKMREQRLRQICYPHHRHWID